MAFTSVMLSGRLKQNASSMSVGSPRREPSWNPEKCLGSGLFLYTIALNGLENVTLTNAAVSDGQETLHFRTHRRNGAPMGGKSKVVDKPGPGVVPVEAVLLDYAVPLERKVSILQLDVEDHEDKALRGAYHIIHKWKPILILEYFGEAGWIRRNFRSLGYEKVGKVHGNYVYAVADVARQLSIPDASDGAAAK